MNPMSRGDFGRRVARRKLFLRSDGTVFEPTARVPGAGITPLPRAGALAWPGVSKHSPLQVVQVLKEESSATLASDRNPGG